MWGGTVSGVAGAEGTGLPARSPAGPFGAGVVPQALLSWLLQTGTAFCQCPAASPAFAFLWARCCCGWWRGGACRERDRAQTRFLRVCLKNSIILLCYCYALSLYRYVYYFLLSLTSVGALPSPLASLAQPPAGCPCGSPRGAGRVSPSRCRSARRAAPLAGRSRAFSDPPSVQMWGAGRLTGGEEGGDFLHVTAAPSRLEATCQLRFRPRSSGWSPSTARRGRARDSPCCRGQVSRPPARSLASVVPACGTEGFPTLGGAKSRFLYVEATAFGSPPFIILLFLFSCERYFRGAVAPSDALPNCSPAIPWLLLVAQRNSTFRSI